MRIPDFPEPDADPNDLRLTLHAARRVLLVLEGKAKPFTPDPAVDAWRGHSEALALLGIRTALELRRRGAVVPLEFFALRMPKGDFELPDWINEREES